MTTERNSTLDIPTTPSADLTRLTVGSTSMMACTQTGQFWARESAGG
jgi:hypothetical protein